MEPLVLLSVLGGAVALAVALVARSGYKDAWLAAAADLGIEFVPATLLQSPQLVGSVDGYDLVVDIVTQGSGNNRRQYTRFVLAAPRIPRDVAMASETFWSRLDLMGQEIEVGDGLFDAAVKVRGVESTVLALLGHETRPMLTRFVSMDRGHVRNSELVSETSGRMKDSDAMVQRAHRMVAMARRLEITDADVPDRMAQNVANDSEPKVRLRNLRYLSTYHARTDACERAAQYACSATVPKLRLAGGRALGAKGTGTLEALVTDEDVEDDVRSEALTSVADSLPRGVLLRLIRTTLESASNPLVRAAANVAYEHRLQELERVALGLLEHPDDGVVASVARALARVGTARSSSRLVRLLDHRDDAVKTAACLALGEVGAIDAVEPLLDHTKGVFKNSDLKRTARAAIDAIQKRAGGADGGRLSVLDTKDGGALSVAKDAGSMAIVDDD